MAESNVDWKEAGKMLAEGCNFAEIAEHFGVSRQYIQQYYTYGHKGRRRKKHPLLYPMFAKWLKSNHETLASIGRKLFPDDKNPSQRLRLIMIGKTKTVPISTIKSLLDVTGMTFEMMFWTEGDDDQQTV